MMSITMKYSPLALSLALMLGMPTMAHAQPIMPSTRMAEQAEIIYLYRMHPADSQPSQYLKDIQQLRSSMLQRHLRSRILFFKDVTDDDHYVSLITNQALDLPQEAGWSKEFLEQYTRSFPGARSFILESSLLIGDARLNVSPSSLIGIEHVDSDPQKRESNLPLFQSLESRLRQIQGFRDIQIWTWNQRTNHWTVIEVWDNAEARKRANQDPEIIKIWDSIYGNAAAPNSQSEYQLLQ
jgi:quinol monooxygenase YgiN